MPCPKCGSINFVLSGTYKIRRSDILRQRFRCKDCRTTFTVRTKSFRKQIPLKIRKKIIRLYKTKKQYKNPFDKFHKETYSTREIAKMLGVSKSFVHSVVNHPSPYLR